MEPFPYPCFKTLIGIWVFVSHCILKELYEVASLPSSLGFQGPGDEHGPINDKKKGFPSLLILNLFSTEEEKNRKLTLVSDLGFCHIPCLLHGYLHPLGRLIFTRYLPQVCKSYRRHLLLYMGMLFAHHESEMVSFVFSF